MMFRVLFITLIGLFVSSAIIFGQDRHILTGTVRAKGDADVQAAIVSVKRTNDGAILSYVTPDSDGRYSVSFSCPDEKVEVSVRGLGLKTLTKQIDVNAGVLDFIIEPESFSLKEVTIKAEKIKQSGDTISYNVASFQSAEDRVIEDVLKKLPGISVLEGGKIIYKGQAVSLTIDGLDLLGGKYAIATKNISPDHIATVEILENHQVIKALQDLVPSDRTTLNLKLKSSSRGIFLCSLGLLGGYNDSTLWNAEGAGMYFGHKSQDIVTAKSNNTGNDLRDELSDKNDEGRALSKYTQALLASPPNLSKNRYYFNRSFCTTANSLVKTSHGNNLTLNAGYLNTDDYRSSNNELSYMLPESSARIINETIQNNITQELIYANLSHRINNHRIYLDSQVQLAGDRSDIITMVNGAKQAFDDKTILAGGGITLIRRSSEKSGYELMMKAKYGNNAHQLKLLSEKPAKQEISQETLSIYGNLTSYRRFNFLGMMIYPSLIYNYSFESLQSGFSGVNTLEDLPYDNDIAFRKINISPSLNASYQSYRWRILLSIPVMYRYMSLLGRENLISHKVIPLPTLDLSHVFSSSLDWHLNYSFITMDKEISTLYDGLIMRNYRTFTWFHPNLTEGLSHAFSSKLNYKDVFKMLFIGASAYYGIGKPKIIYGYNFDGINAETISYETSALSHHLKTGVEASKGFYYKNATLKATIDYIYSDTPYLAQNQETRTSNSVWQLSASLSIEPFARLNLSYSGAFMHSLVRQLSGEPLSPLSVFTNNLHIVLRLPKNWSIGTHMEHYFNNWSTSEKNFFLANANLGFIYKKTRWSLMCNNLFDVKNYVYSSLSNGTGFNNQYQIRPREIMLKLSITL